MNTLIADLRAALGSEQILSDEAALRRYRRDAWVLNDLDEVEQVDVPLPLCVARPRSRDDVVVVVDACRQSATPLVPAGLRSGVSGGVRAGAGSIVLDMSALCTIRSIEARDLIGSFDCGVRGSDAESSLAALGLSLGHFPQSIELSSIGGWVATRAAGQFSTGYGNIEDLVLGLEAVLPDGSIFDCGTAPRSSVGPDLRHLLLGSEGTLGVITGVQLSLRRQPEARTTGAYALNNMRQGLELQREILQSGWAPVVLRLYDQHEVRRLFPGAVADGECLLLTVHEGPRPKVTAEAQEVGHLALNAGCRKASHEAAERWLEERNRVPQFKTFLSQGIIVDTIEVAASYSNIAELYEGAMAALGRIDSMQHASAHSSHGYRSGINLYFTFAARATPERGMRALYHDCFEAVMLATLEHGGTISHHHGIGRVRRDWLPRELGPGRLAALRAVKRALDPVGFMNPGVLLPDDSDDPLVGE